ncbi:plasmid mobilization protein [Infirmifilum sp. SLHALR2]
MLERSETICIRLTPAEKKRLRKEASERGLSLSDYLRLKLLG